MCCISGLPAGSIAYSLSLLSFHWLDTESRTIHESLFFRFLSFYVLWCSQRRCTRVVFVIGLTQNNNNKTTQWVLIMRIPEIEDVTRVVISYEIYETSLGRVS